MLLILLGTYFSSSENTFLFKYFWGLLGFLKFGYFFLKLSGNTGLGVTRRDKEYIQHKIKCALVKEEA